MFSMMSMSLMTILLLTVVMMLATIWSKKTFNDREKSSPF